MADEILLFFFRSVWEMFRLGILIVLKLLRAILWGIAWILSLLGRSAGRTYRNSRRNLTRVIGPEYCRLNPIQGDFLDYRGVARENDLPNNRGGVSLGSYLHFGDTTVARGRRGKKLFLPTKLLRQHCALVAPPGAGKTVSVIRPWILELLQQGNSVVTVDVKNEMRTTVAREAEHLGVKVLFWDFTNPTQSIGWNWFGEIKNNDDVEKALVSILGKLTPGSENYFYRDRDYRWLRALIQIVRKVYKNQAQPQDLCSFLANRDQLIDLLQRRPEITLPFQSLFQDLLSFSVNEYSLAVSGLSNALELFNDDAVQQISKSSDFVIGDLEKQPTLLVIVAPSNLGVKAEVLSTIMLNFIVNHIYGRFNLGDHVRPIYFLIDEAASLRDRIDYDKVLSTIRSAGAGVCLALQDVAQLKEDQRSTILGNCSTLITMQGCSPETARYFSSRLGMRMQQVEHRTVVDAPFAIVKPANVGVHHQQVPVLGDREIMGPPGSRYAAIVLNRDICPKPFVVDLMRETRDEPVV